MAKTLQTAVETLERDKAQLQSRVQSLEQRLMGTETSEGEDREAPPSGEEETVTGASTHTHTERRFLVCRAVCFLSHAFASAGDAAVEQLREEKEFAEGQVRPDHVL